MSKKEHKKTYRKRYLVIVGIVVAAVVISILLYTMLANQPPRIVSLGARSDKVLPLESCQITCHAIDPDEDELSYGWSATGGGITGEGATVTWTAPNSEGSYNVIVTVTDARGGEVINQVTIAVGNQSSGLADRVDVVYFHRTQRCYSCRYMETAANYTVQTYFKDELASGKLTFQVFNVEDEANAGIVKKYQASYLSLYINTVKDGTDHIELVADLYPLIGNDEAFAETLKNKIEKSLMGEA